MKDTNIEVGADNFRSPRERVPEKGRIVGGRDRGQRQEYGGKISACGSALRSGASTFNHNMQFLDLPVEIIHRILSLLSSIQVATCQLVNKHLNAIIAESLVLQYSIALELAIADDDPCSVVSLPQKLENIRSSEAAWASLQPKFITSVPIPHRTSGIYDLSSGTYLLGNADKMSLQYLRLPARVDDPLDWRRITVDKVIIDMGFSVFEHDLIAIITRQVFLIVHVLHI
jgi:hypothetical protein